MTKALVATTSVFSLALGFARRSDLFWLQLYPTVTSKLQLWRFLTCHLGFSTPPDFLLGMFILYAFRIFERQFGSKKFAVLRPYVLSRFSAPNAHLIFLPLMMDSRVQACIATLTLLSTSLQTLALFVLRKQVPYMMPGPYAIIFGLLPFYFMDIPALSRFRLMGLPFSDKLWVYLVALQVRMFVRLRGV